VEGVSGRDARYLHARAAPLLAERPLRNAALLRAMARLTEAPGLAVEARFEQTPGGDPNALRLRIAASRKRVAAGASVNNQGQRLLGRTQYELTAAANGVVHPGDRLQLYYGFPQQNDLYSYAALSYAAPIGVRGLRMQLYASSLRTRPEGLAIAGDAQTASAQLSYPLRESAEASTTISASLDALDSDNAFLGQLIARERTRVLRAGLSYVRVDGAARTQAYAAASFGMDAWGARAAPAYGGPEFAKLTARLAHERPLAPRAILSARMTAQLGARRLPPSERLQFGGEAFGRGFDAGFASASAGVAASTEAARLFTFPGAPASAAEGRLFAFADGARLAADAVFATPGRTLASAGMGLSVRFLRKFDARLTAAAPLAGAHDANGEARLTFGLSATF
ncbi:MAG: ShlB/FhaC/HecB family hemolysin secretion/activation protein, partial [Hyphomonadaceae bacterium]